MLKLKIILFCKNTKNLLTNIYKFRFSSKWFFLFICFLWFFPSTVLLDWKSFFFASSSCWVKDFAFLCFLILLCFGRIISREKIFKKKKSYKSTLFFPLTIRKFDKNLIWNKGSEKTRKIFCLSCCSFLYAHFQHRRFSILSLLLKI